MHLREFVENYNREEIIRIEDDNELVYEGNVGNLYKLLRYQVKPSSVKVVDGKTQIELSL